MTEIPLTEGLHMMCLTWILIIALVICNRIASKAKERR